MKTTIFTVLASLLLSAAPACEPEKTPPSERVVRYVGKVGGGHQWEVVTQDGQKAKRADLKFHPNCTPNARWPKCKG